MAQQLTKFSNAGFERGVSTVKELFWLVIKRQFFEYSVMPWYRLRRTVLKLFGCRLGRGVIIKPGVKITFPWKLQIGANTWIGEDSWLLNLDSLKIGENVCISQCAFLCTGSHDWSDPCFKLITKPITVEDGAWICPDVFIAPGVTVGRNSVVTAGSVVKNSLPPDMICSGNPCRAVKPRVFKNKGN